MKNFLFKIFFNLMIRIAESKAKAEKKQYYILVVNKKLRIVARGDLKRYIREKKLAKGTKITDYDKRTLYKTQTHLTK